MPVRPEIALGVKQQQFMDPAQVLSLRDLATQSDLHSAQLEEYKLGQQNRNALRDIYGNASNLDPATGAISASAIPKIGAIDPLLAGKLGEQQLARQKLVAETNQAQARTAESQGKVIAQKESYLNQTVRGPALAAYEAALPQGEDVAKRAGQAAFAEGLQAASRSGMFSTEEKAQFAMDFDPKRVQQRLQQSTEWVNNQRNMNAPRSDLGNLRRDLEKGIISQKDYDAAVAKKNAPTSIMLAGNQPIPPETLDFMARQYLSGDRTVLTGMARNPIAMVQAREAITKVAKEIGMTPAGVASAVAEFEGQKAGQRTLGTRTANIDMAVTEAQNVIPIAEAASKAVNRTQYPRLNDVILAFERGTGDENVVRLATATNALINIYSRAISPTGTPTVSDKDHAREIISSAYAKGQYSAALDVMKQEMAAAKKAPGQVREDMRREFTGQGKKAPQQAIDHLKAHPELKDAFKAKYGYLPDGG